VQKGEEKGGGITVQLVNKKNGKGRRKKRVQLSVDSRAQGVEDGGTGLRVTTYEPVRGEGEKIRR